MVGRRFARGELRGLTVGLVLLTVLALAYPLFAGAAARPLAAFVLPGLLTAALSGWRPTVLVGSASLLIAIVHGIIGPLDKPALVARWLVIGAGVVAGAVGAKVRDHQSGRLLELAETMALREAFERALAPVPIPPPGFVAVARYRPAEQRMHLGGDFLDAVALSDGRLAVLIGDVCGHGPREAAVGAALRAGWKSIALGDKHDPADWVDALNVSFFRDGRIDTYVTLCTGYLDRSAGYVRLVCAGHPPPIALTRPVAMLDLPPAPPLGLGSEELWTATQHPWGGEPLLFYTDGVTDNPMSEGAPQRWGEAGLMRWLDEHPPGPDIRGFVPALLEAATAGHAFSIEPGIYAPGRWGMRLEDIVVAAEAGPDPLNRADHALIAV